MEGHRYTEYNIYHENEDDEELDTYIRIGENASNEHKSIITGIGKKYSDCFCKNGARHPILNWEF